jgi:hypothetical protein
MDSFFGIGSRYCLKSLSVDFFARIIHNNISNSTIIELPNYKILVIAKIYLYLL